MDEIIFNFFVEKKGDNFLGNYFIKDNVLYYNNILVASYKNDIIELNTNLAIKETIKYFLAFLKKINFPINKIDFYIENIISETYYEILTNYAYYYSALDYDKGYDILQILLQTENKKEFDNALFYLRQTDEKASSLIRKLKIKKFLNEA